MPTPWRIGILQGINRSWKYRQITQPTSTDSIMGREIELFKSKERKNRQEVAEFLRLLADKVASGSIVLKQGQDEVTVQLPDILQLEVEVEDEQKRKKGVQHKLEIELKWYDNDEDGGPLELE
jgi:amphi-Trp domain-containing protein